jgi:hypothetical protein
VTLDKRPALLHRLPDARIHAVTRRQRLACILTRPYGHWKTYTGHPDYIWRCQSCGAVGHYDPI